MHSMGKTIAELHAMVRLHKIGLLKKATPTPVPDVLAIRGGKIQKNNKNKKPKKEKLLDCNYSFLGEYECSSLALDREERIDERKRLDHLKQDQTILMIKRFSERKKAGIPNEKFKGGFEQDIDDEGEEDKEDEEGDGEV
ncbi:hypothetical protein Tco_0988321 [Tanacetum coccineum]|uniref:Uncharacterized protein n=1 Tax=Tanacetum coccineum TaxID=301880 RepID=A0ABQ5EQU7_9ASTR